MKETLHKSHWNFLHIVDVILENEPEIVLACYKARAVKMAKKLPTCDTDALKMVEMVTSILDEKKKGEEHGNKD